MLKAKGNYGLVLRQIPNKMFDLRQIGLPDKIKELLYRPRGLVLVTGPDRLGQVHDARLDGELHQREPRRPHHHHRGSDRVLSTRTRRCVVTQREVGSDVPSFAEAIRRALRQDPDVILVGELRDLETIEAAISAAETGHLVFGTLHTNSAAKTVDRIVDAFPANMKEMIRTQLSTSIIARHFPDAVQKERRRPHRGLRDHDQHVVDRLADPRQQDLPYHLGHPDGRQSRHDHARHASDEPGEPELIDPDEAVEKAQDTEVMRDKLTSMGFKLRVN